MNREILLNSLEEFMEETDARLTALEAAKPQAPENDTAVALASEMTTNAYLMNSIRGLQTQLAGASRQRNALIAERNTLAAQVDDLRNINAGLRKENERLTTALNVWMR